MAKKKISELNEYNGTPDQFFVPGVPNAGVTMKADFEKMVSRSSIGKRTSENDLRWGHYTKRPDIHITAIETDKAVSKDGVKISKNGWAIAEFEAVKGNEYMMKVGTISGDVCLFSEKIVKSETRNIDYSYTYNNDGTIATARAVYGGTVHSYTYAYTKDEESGQITSETIMDDQTHAIVNALPYQYKTSVGTYQPMTVLNAGAELPEDGYCRLVSHFQNDQSLIVAVSFNMSDADLTMKVVRDGYTASICTQLSNLAKRISILSERVSVMDEQLASLLAVEDVIVELAKPVPDHRALPLLCGQPHILFGAGTPQEAVVPDNWIWNPVTGEGYAWNGQPSAIGQQYINMSASSNGRYIAVSDANNNLTWKNF